MLLKRHLIQLILVILLYSCGKEYSCENCQPVSVNQNPIARAGNDQLLSSGTTSTLLSGSTSYDPDGVIVSFSWRQLSGTTSHILNSKDSNTIVNNLSDGSYVFELKVTDNRGEVGLDTVVVAIGGSVSNLPPVAKAGPDQVMNAGNNIATLDGSASYDPDGTIILYSWQSINSNNVQISSSATARTQVTGLTSGIFEFQLTVTDNLGATARDTVGITIDSQPNNSLVDIYVAGDDGIVAKYWKNGQEVILNNGSNNGVAFAIAVVGNDVYLAGEEGDRFMYGSNRARYWKNGQEVMLTGLTGAGARSIAVVGSDIYVAGWERNETKTGSVAKYWKNGQSVSLTSGASENDVATSIVVVDGNVYVAGHENGPENGVAKYWKNDQAVSLTDGSQHANANAIAVVGNDVYVAGSEFKGNTQVAKYWKNGQEVSLTDGSKQATASSIAVVGNDVYVAGWVGDYYGSVGGTVAVAKYWKNRQEVSLTNGSNYAHATSIAVFGNDVYVAGYEIQGSVYTAKYWKNGQSVPLNKGVWALGIVVVPR